MLLLQLDEALAKADVQALAFLCTDLLSKDLSDVSSVSELLFLLQTRDLLSPHETSLLTELLHILKRQSLTRQLALPSRLPEPRFISSYREMLFDLSENITVDDLRTIKFLLHDTLPRRKLDESTEVKLEAYAMNREKSGFCLIINNYNFSSSKINLKNREGTLTDTKNLEAVFQWLGFETHVKQDFSRQQILTLLWDFGGKDHTNMDCFVCCVLSHGVPGGVYGVDGAEVRLSELLQPFSAHHCTSLQQKPKLFFIQACQGIQEQKAVFLQSDGPLGVTSDAFVPLDSFPTDADFLLGMATVPNFVSFRDKKQGTWYIRSLCQKLLLLVPRGIDLLSILTEVNNDVSNMTDSKGTKKQMPQPAYSLRKKVIFPKPKNPRPMLD
ncbi:caspase-8-like [Scleropages formosus]|uniref:Caspase-8 n=1 Tax=Scleropages formosus TaxID=113540 RepID=A0A0P7ZH20_SCLFO|nr:caspase-8-like [Scleropages formosus]